MYRIDSMGRRADAEAARTDLIWDDARALLRKLIQLHPSYASEGQRLAFSAIAEFLKRWGCGQIEVDSFTAADIAGHPLFVPVEKFSDLYADYRRTPKTNVISVLRGSGPGPTVILNGHVDVDLVSTPDLWTHPEGWRSASLRNGFLEGRGASDMLAGLCCLLSCAARLAEEPGRWKGTVILTAVCDEEIGGNGTLRALERLRQSGHLRNPAVEALIAEPTNKMVCSESLGFLSFGICLRRRSRHMGVATRNDSLFDDLWRIESGLGEELSAVLTAKDPLISAESIRANIGTVRGGEDPALPLGGLKVEGTIFFPRRVSVAGAGVALSQALARLVRSETTHSLQLSEVAFEGSSSIDNALAHVLLNDPAAPIHGPGLFPSPCDARLFEHFGIPVTIYGPGDLGEAHAVDERICFAELRPYADHVLRSLRSLLEWR